MFQEWEDLPSDVVKAIAKRLTSIQDYISFRGVCTSWRSAATFDNFDREFPLQVPRLIYFLGQPPVTKAVDLLTHTCRSTTFPPATHYPYLSSSGWLLSLSKLSPIARLLHFIRGQTIDLPPLGAFPGYQINSHLPIIRKMVLSTSSHLVIMVIWGDEGQLGFCRPLDESWTIMAGWGARFSDVIYKDGMLYAVDSWLRIVESDIHGPTPTKIVHVFTFPRAFFLDEATLRNSYSCLVVHNYLVNSSGKFLIVSRYISPRSTLGFRVFEIELKDGSYVEIHNLGRRCLFLGRNSSVCAEFPDRGMETNCIYFTNNMEQCRHQDAGVYTLCDDEALRIFFYLYGYCFPYPTIVVPAL